MLQKILSILFPQKAESSDFNFAESHVRRDSFEITESDIVRKGVYRFEDFSNLVFPCSVSGCHRFFTKTQLKNITSYFTETEWNKIMNKERIRGRWEHEEIIFWSDDLQGYEFLPLYWDDVLFLQE